MDLRLHPSSVTPAEGPEKCGPRRPTRNGYSCNNAAVYGLVDGVVAGFIFGWLYNRFAAGVLSR